MFSLARTRLPVRSHVRPDVEPPCVFGLSAPSPWTGLGALPGLDALKVCKDFRNLPGVEAEIRHVRVTNQDALGKRFRQPGDRIPLGKCAQGRGGQIPAHVAASNRMAADALQFNDPPSSVDLLRGGVLDKDAIAIKAVALRDVRQAGRATGDPQAREESDPSDTHQPILGPAMLAGLT